MSETGLAETKDMDHIVQNVVDIGWSCVIDHIQVPFDQNQCH